MNEQAGSNQHSEYFYQLTPDRILEAVEALGIRCTGRCLALNSMENRVYEVEIEVPEEQVKSRFDRFRVVKFYRPGRWSLNQILEEHEFLLTLKEQEIPVVCPLKFQDSTTLRLVPGSNIYCAVFPKVGGRAPDELDSEQAERIGRLLARLHIVGKAKNAQHRLKLTPNTYGLLNLEFLVKEKFLPNEISTAYSSTVKQICEICTPWFEQADCQRIHGDCHCSNVIWGSDGPFLIDFDDMLMGPSVQDLWLLLPGRDEYAQNLLAAMLRGYEQMKTFDRSTLRLIEPLRALRMIHFSAWIARRWQDPAFQRTFPQFAQPAYWNEQLSDLREQLMLISGHAA